MPRRARLDTTGLLHHVMVRGTEQCLIFRDDRFRENFVRKPDGAFFEAGIARMRMGADVQSFSSAGKNGQRTSFAQYESIDERLCRILQPSSTVELSVEVPAADKLSHSQAILHPHKEKTGKGGVIHFKTK